MRTLSIISFLIVALAWTRLDLRAATRAVDYWPTERWKTAPPETEGVDTDALARGLEQVTRICPDIYGLLVVRHCRL